MREMFIYAFAFNQDISRWNVKKVKLHTDMYEYCPIKEKYKPNGIK
jgi:hypothetical protein